MKHKLNHILFFAVLFVWLFVSSCQQSNGDVTGSEFMPDMAHSIAYEANTYAYYYNNTWGTKEEYYNFAKPGEPVNGTVPRGSAGFTGGSADMDRMLSFEGELTNASIAIPVNGSVPYAYPDTDEGRAQAAAEIINNPIPINDANLKDAKELYNIYCGICHGEKGDGAGYLVRDDGKYPAQPANLLLDEYISLSNGQYYHAIVYGKNLMGGYADKLSNEERWNVIHYIRSLQAKEKKLAYNENENTLDNAATPGHHSMTLSDSFNKQMEANRKARMADYKDMDHGHGHDSHGHDDHHGDDHHGDDHGSHEGDHGHDNHQEGDHGHDDHHGDDHGHDDHHDDDHGNDHDH